MTKFHLQWIPLDYLQRRNWSKMLKLCAMNFFKGGRLFRNKLIFVFQKGIPSFWDENDNLFSEEAYKTLILHQRNDVHKFQDMEGCNVPNHPQAGHATSSLFMN